MSELITLQNTPVNNILSWTKLDKKGLQMYYAVSSKGLKNGRDPPPCKKTKKFYFSPLIILTILLFRLKYGYEWSGRDFTSMPGRLVVIAIQESSLTS